MAQLIVQSNTPGLPRVIDLRPGLNRFGRAPANDCLLDDPAVSNEHCEIDVGHDRVVVRDLGSANGTFIDRQRIQYATLYSGQTLRIGPIEMILDAQPTEVSIPTLHVEKNPYIEEVRFLDDGHRACLAHGGRHAVWECTHCGRPYCDECVKKLRRVGGAFLRLCPSCSNQCNLTQWAESIKRKKKNLISVIAEKVTASFKQSTQLLSRVIVIKKRSSKK